MPLTQPQRSYSSEEVTAAKKTLMENNYGLENVRIRSSELLIRWLQQSFAGYHESQNVRTPSVIRTLKTQEKEPRIPPRSQDQE
jgi:hypothetical protein